MNKPTAETSQYVRLQAAALAIRSNCRKRGSKNGSCGSLCPFYSKDRIPHCCLNMTPPSEWEIEEEKNVPILPER